jgi:hypothetical protein
VTGDTSGRREVGTLRVNIVLKKHRERDLSRRTRVGYTFKALWGNCVRKAGVTSLESTKRVKSKRANSWLQSGEFRFN